MSRQPYVRPVSKTTWYMRHGRYRRYMLRELTCLLVAFYAGLAIWALAVLSSGSAERWQAFLAAQQNGALVVLHAVALVYYLVYMSFDWFKLAPKAMVVQVGETRLSDTAVIAAHVAAWAVLMAGVAWLTGVF